MEGMLNYFIPEDGDSSDHLNVVPLPRVEQLKLQHVKKVRQLLYPCVAKTLLRMTLCYNFVCARGVQVFPLPGQFHFRFKTPFEGTYVWLDVVDDSDAVPDFNGLVISKIARVQSESSTRPAERVTSNAVPANAPDLIQTSHEPEPAKREDVPATPKAFNDDLVGLANPVPQDPFNLFMGRSSVQSSPMRPMPSPMNAARGPPGSNPGPGAFGGNPGGFNPMGGAPRAGGSMGISQMHMGMNQVPNPHQQQQQAANSFQGLQWGGMGAGPQQQQRNPMQQNPTNRQWRSSRSKGDYRAHTPFERRRRCAVMSIEMSRYGPDYHCVTISRNVFEVRSHYVNLRPVGGGSYGIVCSAEDTVRKVPLLAGANGNAHDRNADFFVTNCMDLLSVQLRGRKVAIKKITDVFDDLTDAKRILREMKLLRHLGVHENVINILDVILIPPNVMDFHDIYIVTDLMESDLERIISSSQPLSDAHFQYFLYQILRGMKFIHSGNVLHRDLKPSNLLVNSNCDLSICDFGLARGVEMAHNEDLTEYVVTRWYRAPELLADCQNYNDAVDMWAIGCIFAEMLRRRPFFTGRDPSDQLHMIIRVLGSPTEEEMSFVPHEAAKKAILQHGYYPKADEPICAEPFNFDFERESLDLGVEMPKEELQRLVFSECLSIHQLDAQQMH
ncbi:Cmgc/mapk protein kinase, partial [Globisporangium splendens]